MSVVRWEDPPAAHSKYNALAYAHDLIAHQLKGRPREWGVVAEAPRNVALAHAIAHARLRAYSPKGAFEAVLRNKDGVPTVYARYVGEAGSEATPKGSSNG